ncbi:hypothetical protein AMTR_s00137p00110080 [Amborella trichopoda]|uniref:Uncharacterized protein n=1 Tax=Amborella trichopoda TaxID=13333 RepID=W1NET0_AMBTC|nr:hypothetical protein AMTR_s00137p00110080 [Amborella trichopoda]
MLKAQEKPLIKFFKCLKVKVMGKSVTKMAKSLEWSYVLTPKAEKVTGLLCSHVFTVIDHSYQDVTEFCGVYRTMEMYHRAYSLPFNPKPDAHELS